MSFASDKDCNKNIVTFHGCNNPIVMNYLSSLSDKDVGRKLEGIKLTDKSVFMKEYIFIGKCLKVDHSIHLYIFKHDNKFKAVAWIEVGGKELIIPECPDDVTFEHAYVLTGDVYTSNAIQPGHGVVQIMCADKSWVSE